MFNDKGFTRRYRYPAEHSEAFNRLREAQKASGPKVTSAPGPRAWQPIGDIGDEQTTFHIIANLAENEQPPTHDELQGIFLQAVDKAGRSSTGGYRIWIEKIGGDWIIGSLIRD